MKKMTLLATLAIAALLFASCKKEDWTSFIGTWGVEKIDYYNIDHSGNPIPASLVSITFDPNDTNNGIQLVFRDDKTGEMRDSAIDTVWIENEETHEYDSYIVCPDTVLVYSFTYTYDRKERSLYMNMDYGSYMRTFRMAIFDFSKDSFIYENEYDKDYIEKAYLKRISKTTGKSSSRQAVNRPHKPGALLGGR